MGSTFSNIIGAILVALMLVVGINIAGDMITPSGHEPSETVAEDATAPTAAPEGKQQQAAAPEGEEAPAAEGEEAAPAGEEQQAAAPEGEAAPADEGGAAPNGDAALALIATADAQAGQSVARKCAACHTFDDGGGNRVGPNLFGVVGADIATHEGYRYSSALSAEEGTWTYEALSAFLTKPSEAVPGTKMTFAGVPDPQDRANLIAYLRSISPAAPPPQG